MAELELYYVTNRGHEGKDRWAPERYGTRFSQDGIENLRFGKVAVTASTTRTDKFLRKRINTGGSGSGNELAEYLKEKVKNSAKITAYAELIDKEIDESVQENPTLGSRAMFQDLQDAMNNASDVLVYVHGFNVDWEDAVSSAMALQLMLNKKRRKSASCDRDSSLDRILVILFTWPSDGLALPWVSYKSDKSEARGSGAALARALLKTRDFMRNLRDRSVRRNIHLCNQQIHVLCHSMGNYLLQESLERLAQFTPGSSLPRLFDHIFMCSPDVDDNVMESGEPMYKLHQLARELTVYANRGDKAMVISDYTKGQPERLGGAGAARPSLLHAKVHQVDCTDIASGMVQHSYYQDGLTNADIRQSIDGIAPGAGPRKRKKVGRLDNVWRMDKG